MTDQPIIDIIQLIKSQCPEGTLVKHVPDKPDGREAFSITIHESCKIPEIELMFWGYALSAKFYNYDFDFYRNLRLKHPKPHVRCTNITLPEEQ